MYKIERTIVQAIVRRLATGCINKSSNFESQKGQELILSTSSRPTVGPTQSPIQWIRAVISLRIKRPQSQTDKSPPTNAEFK
jgi:hypothetical protein